MRVRILSGNQVGEVQEVGEAQGEHMCQFGFAERAPAEPPSDVDDRDAVIASADQARLDREQREAQAHDEAERLAAARAIREPGSAGRAAGQGLPV